MVNKTLKYQLLTALLRKLKADKKELGVGQHLQLQQLLASLPDDIPIEQLKVILSPVIAKNDLEQKRLYELFDEVLAEIRLVNEAQEETAISEAQEQFEQAQRRDLRWIMVIGLMLLGGLVAYLLGPTLSPPPPKPLDSIRQLATIQADTSFTFLLDTGQISATIKPIETVYFAEDSLITVDSSGLGTYTLDGFKLAYTSRDTTGTETIAFMFKGADTLKQRLEFVLTVVKRSEPASGEAFVNGDFEEEPLFAKRPSNPVPTKDIASLQRQGLSAWQIWLNNNIWWLQPLLTALSILLFYLILRYRDRRRRKLVAEIEERDQPPYVWTLELDEVPEIETPTFFGRLLRQLRKRTGDEQYNLDIPKTIQATIDRGGMVDFQYRQQSRPPEYLMLIDRQHGDNHRARMFDWMYRQFAAQEVFVERFFFDGDPRLCKNEKYPNGIRLAELQYKFPNARLLIFSQGYQMIDRRTGKLSKWVKGLERWKQRAVLSPRPLQDWGLKERELLNSFELMPATTEGLSYLVEQFDKLADRAQPGQWKDQLKQTPQHTINIDEAGDIIAQLQDHFTPQQVKWIAACAVYPALHWDLTLYLGSMLSEDTGNGASVNLLTVDQLNHLNQLPWFLTGKMPKEVRSQLVTWLQTHHQGFLRDIRQELHQLFQKQAIPEGSVAYQEFQMNVALNEYAFTKDRKKKRQLKQEIAKNIEAGIEGDFTVIKTLEGDPGPLDLVIPPQLRKYAYKSGYKGLGFRRSFSDILWGSFLTILSIASIWFFLQKVEDPCLDGTQVAYQGINLCLLTPADSVLYFEYLAKDSLVAGKITAAKRIVNQAILLAENATGFTPLDTNWTSFTRNIGREFYNLGVDPANKADSLLLRSDTLYLSFKNTACILWETASVLGETGIFANFCSFDRISLFVDENLQSSTIGKEINSGLRLAGYPPFELNYIPMSAGSRLAYYGPDDQQTATQILDTLDRQFNGGLGDFQLVLTTITSVEEINRPDSRRFEIYYDDGEVPIEFVNFNLQIIDSLNNQPLNGLTLRSPSITNFSATGNGRYTFSLQKPLPRSMTIEILQNGRLLKTVQRPINENQTTLGDIIEVYIPQSITIAGRITIDDLPPDGATVALQSDPNQPVLTNASGAFTLTIPGDRLAATIPITITYVGNTYNAQVTPFTQQDNYTFSFEAPETTIDPIQPTQTNTFTDPRDGQVYPTVTINNQTWLAKNLNYQTTDSWCYLELPKLCEKAGRLYTWEAALKACPSGYHLPTDEEWKALALFAGGYSNEGDANAAYLQLIEGGPLGFTAQLGGYRNSDGEFLYLGRDGYFWSASEYDADSAWGFGFNGDGQRLYRDDVDKALGFSVRCVQDN